MDHPPTHSLRNIGIISHIDAGKTTVSERILFYTGEIHKMGEVHDGSATMDWMPQEQERGITITATATTCHWGETTINLIDTPGHIDFTIEVERSLRALDGAIAIFSAVEGVQPQSESVWRQADRYGVPRICFINKLDRIGADYRQVLLQMEQRLQARPVLLQLPLGFEGGFRGVIDLLEEHLLLFTEADFGAQVETLPVPEEMREEVRLARDEVIACAADFDDEVMVAYIEGRSVTAAQLQRALRQGVLSGALHPVLLGAALRNRGIQPLLDAVTAYLPSPLDLPPAPAQHAGENTPAIFLPCDARGPLCALAFKVVADEGRKLTYLRLYSGTLRTGDLIWSSSRKGDERVARLFRMHAHRREKVDETVAGEIVAATGLHHVLTGDTLSRPEEPLLLQGLTIPEPVVSLAVEAKGVEDRERLPSVLEKLQWEDPTFRVHEDAETGQTILTGMGELHLEIIVDRMQRDFGVSVKTGRPQVVYRETLRRAALRHELFQRESEGRIQQGEVTLRLAPGPGGSGIELRLDPEGTAQLPLPLQETLRQSLQQGCAGGVLAGYPLTDLQIDVLQAPYLPGTTTELGLRAAAQRALALGAREGEPTLLEPVMALELIVPEENSGRVLGALQQKRGRIEGMAVRGTDQVIRATVPLAEMFGYMTDLRSATKGRGTYSMEFSHFDRAPDETLRRLGIS